jgi:hypothetical protein
MGRSWEEVQGLGLIYGLNKTSQGGVQLVCPARGGTLSPQQVSPPGASCAAYNHSFCL